MRMFNELIKNSELYKILVIGRNYTWYRLNITVKSRLDWVLVTNEDT